MLDSLRKDNKKIEEFLEWMILSTGVSMTTMGFVGLLLLSFSMITRDVVMSSVFGFVSIYVFFFGLFLVAFHKKILYKPKYKDPYA